MRQISVRGGSADLSVRVFLVAAVLIASALVPSRSIMASDRGHQPLVSNVHFTVEDGQVMVNYDLLGNPNARYKVTLQLRRSSDPSYVYTPREVSGDVGAGKFAGVNRQVVWSISEEFPAGLTGSDYYFVVHADKISSASGPSVFAMIGTGVAVLAAAATYLVVSGIHGHSSTPSGLPAPPGRP